MIRDPSDPRVGRCGLSRKDSNEEIGGYRRSVEQGREDSSERWGDGEGEENNDYRWNRMMIPIVISQGGMHDERG